LIPLTWRSLPAVYYRQYRKREGKRSA
jgi:hypothetical protein